MTCFSLVECLTKVSCQGEDTGDFPSILQAVRKIDELWTGGFVSALNFTVFCRRLTSPNREHALPVPRTARLSPKIPSRPTNRQILPALSLSRLNLALIMKFIRGSGSPSG